MRLPSSLKLELSLAAALAGLGLIRAAAKPAAPVMPATPEGAIAAWRQELGPVSPGRDAVSPSRIPPRGWWQIGKRVVEQFIDHRIMTEAAGVTFYSLLAIFPALAALISLFGLFADPTTIMNQIGAATDFVPGGGLDILQDQIKRLTSTHNGTLSFGAVFGLLFALWSANGGTKSMFDSLNIVYDEKEKRSYFRRTVVSFALTMGSLVCLMFAMAGVVALPIVLNFVGLGAFTDGLLRVVRWPVLMVMIGLLLAVLYRYGPSRTEARWRLVTWGGSIAAVLWVVVSVAFSWYVSNFGSYNRTYGSLGAAVGFMTWIWISAMVVLLGAEIDAEMEHQTAEDTTIGPAKPIGSRGAAKADQVAA